jgi:SET domain-containing protein
MEDVTKNLAFVRAHTLDNIDSTKINQSGIHGFGLFATSIIEASTVLCVLDGQVVEHKHYAEVEALVSPFISKYRKFFFMECNYLEDDRLLIRNIRTKYSYINHSRTPNTKLILDPMRVVAMERIKPDEELTIDYRQEPLTEAYLQRPDKKFL